MLSEGPGVVDTTGSGGVYDTTRPRDLLGSMVADLRRTVGVITVCDGVEPLAAELMLAESVVIGSAFLFFFFPNSIRESQFNVCGKIGFVE